MMLKINIENAGKYKALLKELEDAYSNLLRVANRIRSECPEIEIEIKNSTDG